MADDRAADPYSARKKLTFAQAEGTGPCPSQLKPKALSKRLRALLWKAIEDEDILPECLRKNAAIDGLLMKTA